MTETVLVCSRITSPLLLPDNRIGKCDVCGWKVQFRPHAPKGKRRCLQCAGELIEKGDVIGTTKRMVDDFLAWRRKQQQ